MSRLVWTLTLDSGERRELRQGALTIGRDAAADWTIPDAAQKISRVHCRLEASASGLVVHDLSSNGTFLNAAAERLAAPIALSEGDRLGLGDRQLTVGMVASPLRRAAAGPHNESAILSAFCEGAGLDPSVFAARDMLDVMNDLGAVYREMLKGMGELMHARATVRADLAIDGTTLQSQGNNPFKWAGPDSLARDLLDAQAAGYLDGGGAVSASFADLLAHHEALAAALTGGIRLALDAVDPDRLAAETTGAGLPGGHGRAWRHFLEVHKAATDVRGVTRLAGAAYAGGRGER